MMLSEISDGNGLNIKDFVHIFLSFNGSGFDNFYLYKSWKHYSNEDKRIQALKRTKRFEEKYIQASGKMTLFEIELKNNKHYSRLIFRDVLLYLPADKRGTLKKVCTNLSLDFQKEDCSVEEIQQAFEQAQSGTEDELFEKVHHYCKVDTYCVFGIAKYMGDLYSSVEQFREFFEHPVIPINLGFLYYFFTAAQSAYKLFPYCAMTPPTGMKPVTPEELSEKFKPIEDAGIAMIARKSIYGGKTLSPAIGMTITPPPGHNIGCWDISSMYPTGALGLLPCGNVSQADEQFIDNVNQELEQKTFNPHNFLPFIAMCNILKAKPLDDHVDTPFPVPWERAHAIDDIFPFVPYRPNSLDAFDKKYKGKISTPSEALEWISHTNGISVYGYYNCIDVYTMMKMGFTVEICKWETKVLIWEDWSPLMGSCFRVLYTEKFLAKKAKNPSRETIFKLLMNGFIGKLAQRPCEKLEQGLYSIYRTGKSGNRNSTLFQLNSFIMSYTRRMSLGFFSAMAWGDPLAFVKQEYYKLWRQTPIQRVPFYSDTDNLIFLHSGPGTTQQQALVDMNIHATGDLGKYYENSVHFDFHVEPEFWCKGGGHMDHGGMFIFARKFYLLGCAECPSLRLKNKGHNSAGIDPVKYYAVLDQAKTDPHFLLYDSLSYCDCAPCVTLRLFCKTEENFYLFAQRPITSQPRFSIKKTLAPKGAADDIKHLEGAFILKPSFIERTISVTYPFFQQRCENNKCRMLVHKDFQY
jgi:hypothetical protein